MLSADIEERVRNGVTLLSSHLQLLEAMTSGNAVASYVVAFLCSQLMTGSLQLDLNEAKNNLRACEDDADERKALGAYRTVGHLSFVATV